MAKPTRVETKPEIITALSEVNNLEITRVKESPYILYIEGHSDDRILRAWAQTLGKEGILNKFYSKVMGGGNKGQMKEDADKHFSGLRQIVPKVKRLMLFDYDTDKEAFHPGPGNKTLFEWERKNIENYLLVEDAWHRTVGKNEEYNLFNQDMKETIRDFFASQNLSLPKKTDWKTVDADIFKVVNGKKILFERETSLFQQLKQSKAGLKLNQETIAANMLESEIHEDIVSFFEKLESLVKK